MISIEELSEIFKALSDPSRLKIIRLLAKSKTPLCVNALTAQLGITQSAVSQHLKVLRHNKLVLSERRGYFIHYSLNQPLFDQISDMIDQALYQ